MKDVDPNWLLGSLYPDFIVGGGRLAITYYQELLGSTYLHNIQKWHKECSWHLSYVTDKGTGKKMKRFIGTPSPHDIALTAYGKAKNGSLQLADANDQKKEKQCIDRILPCIVEGRRIPKDIVRAAVNNADNPMRFSKNGNQSDSWEKIVEISCALIHKEMEENLHENQKEVNIMSLDLNNHDRSYLFGELLAVFKKEEEYSNFMNGVDRSTTTADIFWNAFTCHPAKTAMIIEGKLQPYILKLKGGTKDYYSKLIERIMKQLKDENGFTNQPLTEQYLLGYYCQYAELRYNDNKTDSKTNEKHNNETDSNTLADDQEVKENE